MVKLVDNYTLTTYLGKGEYGKVFRAYHMDTKMEVAVKMVPLDKFIQVAKLSELTRNQIQTLRALQKNLNVVKFVEMIKTNNHVYLVYQFCEGGTLEALIRHRKTFPQREALSIFRQLVSGMRSLHEASILHRDIKPDNIFFKSGHLKLADFGFCKRLRGPDDFTQTSLGSPLYMAPQVLNGEVYGSKADVWSCGVVLYEMLFGYCPYGHCNIKEMLEVYQSGERAPVPFPENVSLSAVTHMMLRRMLEKDQFRRISWEDFFYEYDITPEGTVLKREKDFEYDLMKLIKRTSQQPKTAPSAFKFDWTRITDKNSSVHSEQLGVQAIDSQEGLDGLLFLKRQIKNFENEHARMLELSLILEALLDAKDHQYSNPIMYFLVHTLALLATLGQARLEAFAEESRDMLASSPAEAQAVNKLQIVFRNEAAAVSAKANSIKVTLMQCETLSKEIFKFPQRSVLRKFLGQYLQRYETGAKGATVLGGQGNREETLFLLRVVWGCVLALEDDWESKKYRELRDIPSVKPETTKFEISVQLNRLLVYLGL